MKFGQYMKVENIKNKIDEDEKQNKKSRRIKECSDDESNDVDGNGIDDNFDEQTKLLHTVMRFTQTFGSSKNLLEKTECILVIFNLLTTHLNRFIKNNIEYRDNEDGEMVFEKNKSTGI